MNDVCTPIHVKLSDHDARLLCIYGVLSDDYQKSRLFATTLDGNTELPNEMYTLDYKTAFEGCKFTKDYRDFYLVPNENFVLSLGISESTLVTLIVDFMYNNKRYFGKSTLNFNKRTYYGVALDCLP